MVILHLVIIRSEINFTLRVKMNNIVLMGIDHNNPYIHSTTVLCDMICWYTATIVLFCRCPKVYKWKSFSQKCRLNLQKLETKVILQTTSNFLRG